VKFKRSENSSPTLAAGFLAAGHDESRLRRGHANSIHHLFLGVAELRVAT
jgi:hypothetical protein